MPAANRPIRYPMATKSIAFVTQDLQDADFQHSTAALIANESHDGCCLILLKQIELNAEQTCLVQVGELAAMQARVAWINSLDDDLVRVGFQYLE